MSRRKSATPKERVLAATLGFDAPYCRQDNGFDYKVCSYRNGNILGEGRSERAAWADAAKRLRGTGKRPHN